MISIEMWKGIQERDEVIKVLVEALTAMRRTHGMHGPCEQNSCKDCDNAYEKARQALAKANPGSGEEKG